jgi:hypothetical protein
MGLSKPPRVVMSSEVTSPFVAGIFGTWLVLPADIADALTPEELHMTLAHELSHVKRHDLLVGLVPSLARLLFFFLPPVYFACREWVTEREAICDADAMALTQSRADAYGNLLLKIVARDHVQAMAPCIGATANFYTLKRRLSLMKSTGSKPPALWRATIPAVGLLLGASLFSWQCSSGAAASSGGNGATSGNSNLVKNGDFEKGLEDWSPFTLGGQAPVETTISDSGHTGKALQFVRTDPRFFPVQAYQQHLPLPPASATKITVSAWVKAENAAKATIPIFLDSGPADGSILWGAYIGEQNSGDAPANHDWKQYTNTFDIPKGTIGVRVGLEMYGPGKVLFDDLEVTYK